MNIIRHCKWKIVDLKEQGEGEIKIVVSPMIWNYSYHRTIENWVWHRQQIRMLIESALL